MSLIRSEKPLAGAFFLSGIWNLAAASAYVFLMGATAPQPVDRFNTLFIAVLLFSFAWIEIVCSFSIRQYLPVVGAVTAGRVLYVILLAYYLRYVPGFPADFWWTGAVDFSWAVLYIVLAVLCGIRVRDLFLPRQDGH
jgi:hypothetical protein